MKLRRIISTFLIVAAFFTTIVAPEKISYAAETMKLPYKMEDLKKIGSQAERSKKPGGEKYINMCAAFCVAYANAILYGRIADPDAYSNSANNQCDWSKGEYKRQTAKYGVMTKQQILEKAYDELSARRLPIIYVRSKKDGGTQTHWVLAIGYQNVADRNSLKEENFVVIDPWNLKEEELINGKHEYELNSNTAIAVSTDPGTTVPFSDLNPRTQTNAKVKMTCASNVKILPEDASENAGSSAVGDTFVIGAYGLNKYGNVWYQILDGKYKDRYIYSGKTDLLEYVDDVEIVSRNEVPANLKQGKAHSLAEVISTRHQITKITGTIYAGSEAKYTASVSPNVHGSYSMKGTVVDNKLYFNKLPPGAYRYVLRAEISATLDYQQKGGGPIGCLFPQEFIKEYSRNFNVVSNTNEPSPVTEIQWDIGAQSDRQVGKGFNIYNEVRSVGSPIKTITCWITDTNTNQEHLNTTVNVNAYVYPLKRSELDFKMRFDTLPIGRYKIGFRAVTQDGTTSEKYTNEFNIYDPNHLLGDVNGDKSVNIIDARWLLQVAVGARTLEPQQTAVADVNKDGKINIIDARWLLQVAVGARTLQ